VCVVVTVVVSLLTKPKPDGELTGLVYALTTIPPEEQVSVFHRPVFWAVVVGAVLSLNHHANIWWSRLLLVPGAVYCYRFSPARERVRNAGNP
jgi:hypothetical protein